MVLLFERVAFRYSRSRPRVFNDFSWRVPPGRTVLLGPNGAGKSTLLALGANSLRPANGRICFGTLDPSRRADRAAYRRAIGWMPQQVRAVPGLSVQEQVAYAAWLKGARTSQAWCAARAALDRVDLSELAGQKTSTLSGGQLRRVGLAQLFVHDATLLFLDEPSVGLDPAQRSRFRDLLASLSTNTSFVVSTHQVDDLSDLFDTVVVIDGGTIRFEGSVSTFLELAPLGESKQRAEAAYSSIVSRER